MAITRTDLIDFLREQAENYWRETGRPYPLSQAGNDLRRRGIDPKPILGSQTLKTFVATTQMSGSYSLAEDPNDPHKVGIVPNATVKAIAAVAKPMVLKTLTEEERAARTRALQQAIRADIEAKRQHDEARADIDIVQRSTFPHGRTRTVQVEVRKKRPVEPPRLPPSENRPAAVEGVPSAFGYAWSERNTIVMKPSSASLPRFPFPSSERDHARRVEACRTLAEDLTTELGRSRGNMREDYGVELKKYASRLPSSSDVGNVLLADAAARTLRDLFAAEADILPTPFAARLKTLLEHHIGLRPYYPEIEIFYRDVRSGQLQAPLPLDAVNGVVRAVQAHTPEIFDSSVVTAIDESATPNPAVKAEPAAAEPNQPVPPPDPLGELDPAKAHDFQVAGVVNKLWQVFMAGEKIYKAGGAWRAAYDALSPPVANILTWLRQVVVGS